MNPTRRPKHTTITTRPISTIRASRRALQSHLHDPLTKIKRDAHLCITIRWGCRRSTAGMALTSGLKIILGGPPC